MATKRKRKVSYVRALAKVGTAKTAKQYKDALYQLHKAGRKSNPLARAIPARLIPEGKGGYRVFVNTKRAGMAVRNPGAGPGVHKWTISEIRAANKAAGHYFFERATMRAFNSVVYPNVYQGSGGIYFITSEQFQDGRGYKGPRLYKVRRFNVDGDITNDPLKKDFHFKDDARIAARMAARGN